MRWNRLLGIAVLLSLPLSGSAAETPPPIRVTDSQNSLEIQTDQLQATIIKRGYVSGVGRGSLIDRKTGAKDLGFGLHIMDFLMAPGWREDEYSREPKYHGNLPKHYVEGPQICTQAKAIDPQIIRGKDFVAIVMRYQFHQPGAGYQAGSTWEQTLIFQNGQRYFLSSERIRSVNSVNHLFYRIDMPGHIQHQKGDSFEKIYLSYRDQPIPASEFQADFAPDAKFLYQRNPAKIPERFIRAYQVKRPNGAGPWLAGMTLNPGDVSEAWCHQRGYVCFIQELHGKRVQAGQSFGAAYVVGWFDSVDEMHRVYDQYRGKSKIVLDGTQFRLEAE
ncbi:hypothetical protein [Tuwongella immobilis]|uniref:Uncharacterized protein n=1 Tax=Tuwongella immobilis TaxID=692036 RepID=A0A6C2YRF5_9BACT|nr:hypothetical protein [Tuwongella immobilis]VIP04240.1 Uncharacterized protein OS=Pirellula staleyi (strain ATCC 27377 / DSM 6068 / ICPB 4128) GN=Psta_1398 PE=4 SV=1 [Tuwongella immobilis]VTS05844.1 Uncharacterized protein OS=Pirellula staleyi (strain ATCC 27377 / DSM 6068 / ICPB 4128) GN=Psta_1398 PE=4 SV=1 [Tuwongella immobilis]